MTVSLKHLFQSSIPDDPDTSLVRPSDWNAEHTLTLDTGKLLGRSSAGTGAAEEITVGSGLSLSGGTLSNSQSTTLTVGTTATSGGAAGQIMFDTGSVLQESSNLVWNNTNGGLTVSSIANPAIPSLTINGASNYTGATLSGVQITGTAGQFSCNATTLVVGQFVTISGTFGGTGSITGYASPTTYRISATNGTTTFTLVNALTGAAIVTTAGTPINLTYTVTDPLINLSQTWNNSNVLFRGLQYNVTDTASNANSLLMDLKTNGASRFSVLKNGTIYSGALNGGVALTCAGFAFWYFGGVSPTDVSQSAFLLDASNTRFQGRSNAQIGWSSNATNAAAALDTILTRRSAANLRFGAADAAAPVAQTLSVQSVVAGTTDTAGANLTITGSQGTGTGAGGSIIFQVAPAGSTGTAQNALSTALTIASDRSVTFTNSVFGVPYFALQPSGFTNGIILYNTGTAPSMAIVSAGELIWGSNATNAGSGQDLYVGRRGAANLRLGRADAAAPVAQTLSVQSVVAGTSNTAGANLTITGSQGTGTGAGGSIIFQVAPAGTTGTAQNALVDAFTISSNRSVSLSATASGYGLFGSASTYNGYHASSLGEQSIFSSGTKLIGLHGGTGFIVFNQKISFSSNASYNTQDLILSRRAAANLQLGAADAAAPVAQTLSVQSVVAGTTDTAGANLTITGSQSTGTGAAGNIIFQTSSAAASTGTAQNALATVATIGPNTLTGSQAISLLDLAQTWNTTGTPSAIKLNVTDTASNAASLLMNLQVGGTTKFSVAKNGQVLSGYTGASVATYSFVGDPTTGFGYRTTSTVSIMSANTEAARINFTNGVDGLSRGIGVSNGGPIYLGAAGTPDTYITRRGAANLRFGAADAAAPVAQTLSVQSVVAGTTDTAGANLTITGSQGTGTGAGGSIIFQVAPAGSSGTAQNALSTAMTITSSIATNNIAVSIGTPSSLLVSAGYRLAVSGASNIGRDVYVESTQSDGSTSGGRVFVCQNSGSATTSGARLGAFFFAGSNGSTITGATAIQGYASENWSAGAQGSRFEFGTTANGGTSRTVKLIIGGNGLITFGATEANTVPALKPSSTILQVRLADDSAYAPVEASTVRTATAYTVATLPAAGTAGRRAYVTDATAPTWLGALTGGGAVVCPVFDNGTAWVAG